MKPFNLFKKKKKKELDSQIKVSIQMSESAESNKYKFCSIDKDGEDVEFDYGNIFEIETTTNFQRIKIGASKDQSELMMKLAQTLNPPYFILYVLVTSRRGNQPARYQSPIIETWDELKIFMDEYKIFFETDGRHHLWIGTVEDSGLLIYDQHNVIFVYGELEKSIHILEKQNYIQNPVVFPVPHGHSFHEENDIFEEKILRHFNWEIFPLAGDDLYE